MLRESGANSPLTRAQHGARGSRRSHDDTAMRHAIDCARRGSTRNSNPRVGAVVLSADGRFLADGFHRGAGTPHAEFDALAKLAPGHARGSTVVVTLEPCNHVGKTGPCSAALIAAGVSRVVYAVGDPGTRSGGGARTLAAAGIETVRGVLADEASELIRDWLVAARLGRPFVTLKWASSLDGRVAALDGSSRWITGADARRRAHEQRSAHDAVVVGIGTVLADDPSLTARASDGTLVTAQPVPVVIGARPIPAAAAVWRHPHPPIVIPEHDLDAALDDLWKRGMQKVLVEGGATLASAFVGAALVDEFTVYLSPTLLGGGQLALTDIGVSTIAHQHNLEIVSTERVGSDILIVARPSPPTDSPASIGTEK